MESTDQELNVSCKNFIFVMPLKWSKLQMKIDIQICPENQDNKLQISKTPNLSIQKF